MKQTESPASAKFATYFWRLSPLVFASVAPLTGVAVMEYYLSGFPAKVEVMSLLGLQSLALGWAIISTICLGMCFLAIFQTNKGWRIIPIVCTITTLLITLIAAYAIVSAKRDLGFFMD